MNKDIVNYEAYHAEGRTSEFDDPFEQLRSKSIRDVLRWQPQLNSAKKVVDCHLDRGEVTATTRLIIKRAMPGEVERVSRI